MIDEVLPGYLFRHQDWAWVKGNPEDIWPLVRHAKFDQSALTRLLYALRGIPDFPASIDGMINAGFSLHKEVRPKGFVLGAAGKFWQPDGGLLHLSPDEFIDFQRHGFARVVIGFHLVAGNGRTKLVTESRIDAHGRRASVLVTAYWSMIYLFSRYIRRDMLASIQRRASIR